MRTRKYSNLVLMRAVLRDGPCYFLAMNFADPKTNVLQLGLREGMKVADLGSGPGHYGIAAASVVGNDGKVYLVDIQEDVLRHAIATAHAQGKRNVDMVWGDLERVGGTKLKESSMDAVLLSNTLFQVEHKQELLKETLRILKPGGKLLVIDWAGAYGGIGPDPRHVVTERQAEELFVTGGFYKQKDFRAGAHHYAIVFIKP